MWFEVEGIRVRSCTCSLLIGIARRRSGLRGVGAGCGAAGVPDDAIIGAKPTISSLLIGVAPGAQGAKSRVSCTWPFARRGGFHLHCL
jgi:hypothetical protein